MDVTLHTNETGDVDCVNVTLSRRNMDQLRRALDNHVPGRLPSLRRRVSTGETLFITLQEDADHYGTNDDGSFTREPGPGLRP